MLFQFLLTGIISTLDLDLSAIVDYFPFLYTGYEVFKIIGIGLAALIAIFAIVKFFAGPLAENRESPTNVLIRTGVAIATIYFGGYLINWMVDIAKLPFMAFVKLSFDTTSLRGGAEYDVANAFATFCENIAQEVAGITVIGNASYSLGMILLNLIVVLGIGWNVLKLAIEICERYLMVGVLAYTSPLAFCTISSEGTSAIFKKWLSMFMGQLIIMTLSIWSYDLVISGLLMIADDNAGYNIVRMMMVFASARIGLRVDTYMQQLGIGVGATGGSLLDETMGIAHTLGNFLKSRGSRGGVEARTGNSVLGGSLDSKGNVRPDAFGAGLFGSVATGIRYGANAWKNGASGAEAWNAAKEGAVKGFGFSKNVDGTQDRSLLTGRKANNTISHARAMREAARNPVTQSQMGEAIKSADESKTHLDKTAQDNGLKLGKDNVLSGPAGVSGGFMAANFGKEAAGDILSNTARQGDPTSSEAALFGTHNNLKHDSSNTEMGKKETDQLGSDMLAASMSRGMQDLERKAASGEKLSQDEQNLLAANSVMKSSMQESADGKPVGAHLQNFEAKDIGGDPDKGRQVTAQMVDDQGKVMGAVSAVDQKGYDGMSKEEQSGFVPMKSASGETYYMRATGGTAETATFTGPTQPLTDPNAGKETAGTAASGDGKAVVTSGGETVASGGGVAVAPESAAPVVAPDSGSAHQGFFSTANPSYPEISSEWQENGVSLKESPGASRGVISCDDDSYMGAAICEGLGHSNMAVEQVAKDTIRSSEMRPDVAESALFSEQTVGIGAGHDQEIATMMEQVFSPGEIDGAIGRAMEPSGANPIIPVEDASHFSDALSHAAAGTVDGSGYKVENFKTTDGFVSCDYITPSGDGYHVEMAKEYRFDESSPAPAGSVEIPSSVPENGYRVSVTPSAPAPAAPQISAPEVQPGPVQGAPSAPRADADTVTVNPEAEAEARAARQVRDSTDGRAGTLGASEMKQNKGRRKKKRR